MAPEQPKKYEHQEYPKHMYHESHTVENPYVVEVVNKEQEEALGDEFSEKIPEPKKTKKKSPKEKRGLQTAKEALGDDPDDQDPND